MIVDKSSYDFGREAMMYASFFYYQLLEDGEFNCGQTSFWLFDRATCWELLDIEVIEPKGISLGIDAAFIKEAALVYILCSIVNQYEESESQDYPQVSDYALKVITEKGQALIPEISQIIESVSNSDLEYFYTSMTVIFERYVKGRFVKLIEGVT